MLYIFNTKWEGSCNNSNYIYIYIYIYIYEKHLKGYRHFKKKNLKFQLVITK